MSFIVHIIPVYCINHCVDFEEKSITARKPITYMKPNSKRTPRCFGQMAKLLLTQWPLLALQTKKSNSSFLFRTSSQFVSPQAMIENPFPDAKLLFRFYEANKANEALNENRRSLSESVRDVGLKNLQGTTFKNTFSGKLFTDSTTGRMAIYTLNMFAMFLLRFAVVL